MKKELYNKPIIKSVEYLVERGYADSANITNQSFSGTSSKDEITFP